MTRYSEASFPDPAQLEAAARELHAVATRAVKQAAALQEYRTKLDPVTAAVTAIIGGTATGTDKQIRATVTRASHEVAGAESALAEAARTAERLAHEALATAREARRHQAERQGR